MGGRRGAREVRERMWVGEARRGVERLGCGALLEDRRVG